MFTFTVTGASGDTLTCGSGSNVVAVSTDSTNQGLAKCVLAAGQRLAAGLPHGELEVVAGAGHRLALQAPDAVAAALAGA